MSVAWFSCSHIFDARFLMQGHRYDAVIATEHGKSDTEVKVGFRLLMKHSIGDGK